MGVTHMRELSRRMESSRHSDHHVCSGPQHARATATNPDRGLRDQSSAPAAPRLPPGSCGLQGGSPTSSGTKASVQREPQTLTAGCSGDGAGASAERSGSRWGTPRPLQTAGAQHPPHSPAAPAPASCCWAVALRAFIQTCTWWRTCPWEQKRDPGRGQGLRDGLAGGVRSV